MAAGLGPFKESQPDVMFLERAMPTSTASKWRGEFENSPAARKLHSLLFPGMTNAGTLPGAAKQVSVSIWSIRSRLKL